MNNTFTNKMLKLKTRPTGAVTSSHFELVEESIPDLEEGQILVKVLYLSFDPTQRGWLNDVKSYVPPVQIGEVMRAGSVGQVIDSRDSNFKSGDIVQGSFGWQEYATVNSSSGIMPIQKVPEGIPPTSALSIYGITGLTAFFGMVDIGKPVEGDTVLNIKSISNNTWAYISYQAIIVSLGAHLLMFYLYKFYTVGQIFPSYSLFPIFGIGLSFLIFGEIPTLLFLVGSIIVLTSVFLLHKTR